MPTEKQTWSIFATCKQCFPANACMPPRNCALSSCILSSVEFSTATGKPLAYNPQRHTPQQLLPSRHRQPARSPQSLLQHVRQDQFSSLNRTTHATCLHTQPCRSIPLLRRPLRPNTSSTDTLRFWHRRPRSPATWTLPFWHRPPRNSMSRTSKTFSDKNFDAQQIAVSTGRRSIAGGFPRDCRLNKSLQFSRCYSKYIPGNHTCCSVHDKTNINIFAITPKLELDPHPALLDAHVRVQNTAETDRRKISARTPTRSLLVQPVRSLGIARTVRIKISGARDMPSPNRRQIRQRRTLPRCSTAKRGTYWTPPLATRNGDEHTCSAQAMGTRVLASASTFYPLFSAKMGGNVDGSALFCAVFEQLLFFRTNNKDQA